MPRPPDGYHNAAGDPVPGTHDPIKRFADKTALMYWANAQGRKGLTLNDRTAIDIGGAVHLMAEHDLLDRPDSVIEEAAYAALPNPEHLAKAVTAFNAYRSWRARVHLRPVAIEEPLVSERWQYGGTPDLIAVVNNALALVDFKTSARPYPDNLVALAAHANLWNEHHPDEPIETCWLICLPKDGAPPQPFQWDAADLRPQWLQFRLWLRSFRLEARCEEVMRGGLLMVGEEAGLEFSAA
jgi:hypothetical protein